MVDVPQVVSGGSQDPWVAKEDAEKRRTLEIGVLGKEVSYGVVGHETRGEGKCSG